MPVGHPERMSPGLAPRQVKERERGELGLPYRAYFAEREAEAT